MHVNDFDDDEYFNMWYQHDEYQVMREEIKETVSMISSGKYNGDNEKVCSRGLECHTQRNNNVHKQRSVLAVLQEQIRQDSKGLCDPEAIRRVYVEQTHQCVEAARTLGENDEAEAKGRAKENPRKNLCLSPRRMKRGVLRFGMSVRRRSSGSRETTSPSSVRHPNTM